MITIIFGNVTKYEYDYLAVWINLIEYEYSKSMCTITMDMITEYDYSISGLEISNKDKHKLNWMLYSTLVKSH